MRTIPTMQVLGTTATFFAYIFLGSPAVRLFKIQVSPSIAKVSKEKLCKGDCRDGGRFGAENAVSQGHSEKSH